MVGSLVPNVLQYQVLPHVFSAYACHSICLVVAYPYNVGINVFIFDLAATYVSSGLEPNGGACRVLSSVPAPIRNEYGAAARKQSAGHAGMRDGARRVSDGANGRGCKLRESNGRVPKSSQS